MKRLTPQERQIISASLWLHDKTQYFRVIFKDNKIIEVLPEGNQPDWMNESNYDHILCWKDELEELLDSIDWIHDPTYKTFLRVNFESAEFQRFPFYSEI